MRHGAVCYGVSEYETWVCACVVLCRKLLAEASLGELELEMAEKAFVKCEDYQGIQLVKQLHHLNVSSVTCFIVHSHTPSLPIYLPPSLPPSLSHSQKQSKEPRWPHTSRSLTKQRDSILSWTATN